MGSALALEDFRLHQVADILLEEERVAVRALDQHLLEGVEPGVVADETLEEFRHARRGEGIDPDLGVVALAPPAVAVLGPIVDEEEYAGGR